jgi:hypothetical protein
MGFTFNRLHEQGLMTPTTLPGLSLVKESGRKRAVGVFYWE